MPYRVQDILLVSSLYDSFILQEDGQLNERILGEFRELEPAARPRASPTSRRGAEALALCAAAAALQPRSSRRLHVGDMDAAELARGCARKGSTCPVVLLAYDARELERLRRRATTPREHRARLPLAGRRADPARDRQVVEDRRNVAHDTRDGGRAGRSCVVEDSVRYYSSFLPVIYTELLPPVAARSSREGINLSHKLLRMRARPKILLCRDLRGGLGRLHAPTSEDVLGVISDVEFPRGGVLAPTAGVELARRIGASATPTCPILLQSSRPRTRRSRSEAGRGASCSRSSPLLLHDLRRFMVDELRLRRLRLPPARRHARSAAPRDLKSLEEKLRTVPAESVAFHGERNHFSNWLKARTEFALAHSCARARSPTSRRSRTCAAT